VVGERKEMEVKDMVKESGASLETQTQNGKYIHEEGAQHLRQHRDFPFGFLESSFWMIPVCM